MVSDSWAAHTSHFKPSPKFESNKSYEWTCKYCGKTTTSGVTRLEEHLAKVAGNIAACKTVPKDVSDENPKEEEEFC